MKFIFPQNYNFQSKLFGIFDYYTVLFNFVCWIITFFITNLFINDLFNKIIFFIIFCFPIFLISVFAFGQENIIYVLIYLFKYYKKNKLYLYKK